MLPIQDIYIGQETLWLTLQGETQCLGYFIYSVALNVLLSQHLAVWGWIGIGPVALSLWTLHFIYSPSKTGKLQLFCSPIQPKSGSIREILQIILVNQYLSD